MRPIIYYVATSLDGFIAGEGDDISGFAQGGAGVNQYLQDLQTFDTTIMGRRTYEFGYQYGLEPGQPAYRHMDHYIFSNTLKLETIHRKVKVGPLNLQTILDLKATEGSPIYLCGGGQFAGWLLENELIDVLKIKLNPLLLGSGIRLFGDSKKIYQLTLQDRQSFEEGLQILTYQLNY
ncbi:MAG: dihydrofolate reductase family protein [Saprospiraceae bacterium]